MLLTIDIGNTNIDFAVFRKKEPVLSFKTPAEDVRHFDYEAFLKASLKEGGLSQKDIPSVILSSVVSELTERFAELVASMFHTSPFVVGKNVKLPIGIHYDFPEKLGTDRIVSAIGAGSKYGAPAIVVDAGTAVTIDFIDEQGGFQGGIIAPGISLLASSLYKGTSKLPEIKPEKPQGVIGKNTADCIKAGVYYGFLGLTDGIIKEMLNERKLPKEAVNIIATGGASTVLRDSKYIKTFDPLLLHEGLRSLYEYQEKQ